MFTPAQIARLTTAALEGTDGHTEYTHDDPTPSARYLVSTGENAMQIPQHVIRENPDLARHAIAGWAAEHGTDETLGYWAEDGIAYFDAGETYSSLDYALRLAHDRGELAIFDRATYTSIYTPTPQYA